MKFFKEMFKDNQCEHRWSHGTRQQIVVSTIGRTAHINR